MKIINNNSNYLTALSKPRKYLLKNIAPLFILIVANFLFVRNMKFGNLYNTVDHKPFYSLPKTIELFLSSWTSLGFGHVNTQSTFMLVKSVVIFLSPNPTIAQNIMIITVLPLSSLTCFYLLTKLEISSYFSPFFALFYAYNPATISNTGTVKVAWIGAVLPLLVLLIFQFVESEEKETSKIYVYILIFGIFATNPWVTFWALIPFLFGAGIMLLSKREMKKLGYLIGANLAGSFLHILNFYTMALSRTSAFDNLDSLTILEYTYSATTIPNILRIFGNTGTIWNRIGYATTQSAWQIIAFVFPILAILSLLRLKKTEQFNTSKTITGIGMVFLISIILTLSSFPSTIPSVLRPLILSLRNPLKLLLPLSLAITILSAFGITNLLTILNSNKILNISLNHIRPILSILLIVSIISYTIPIHSGDLGYQQISSETWEGDASKGQYYINDTQENSFTEVQQLTNGSRTLILPFYIWDENAARKLLPNYAGLGGGAQFRKNSPTKEVENLYRAIGDRKYNEINTRLDILNIEYIMISKERKQDGNVRLSNPGGFTGIVGPSNQFEAIFERIDGVEKIRENKSYILYKNKGSTRKKIELYDQIDIFAHTQDTSVVSTDGFKMSNGGRSEEYISAVNAHTLINEINQNRSTDLFKVGSVDYPKDDVNQIYSISPNISEQKRHAGYNRTYMFPTAEKHSITLGKTSDLNVTFTRSLDDIKESKKIDKKIKLSEGKSEISADDFNVNDSRFDWMIVQIPGEKKGTKTEQDNTSELNISSLLSDEYALSGKKLSGKFIYFDETYHPGWQMSNNAQQFKAFGWSNGFYITQSNEKNEARMYFEQKTLKRTLISIWGLGWIVFLSAFIFHSRRN